MRHPIAFFVGMLICLSAQVAVGQTKPVKGVMDLPDEYITGVRQKPSAFYILQPDALSYTSLKVDEHFIEALKQSVQENDVF